MAAYDPYDSPTWDRRYDDRGARYAETRESQHLKIYPPSRELVPRHRENSDVSIEEVNRDFPPPGYRDVRRARSAEPGYYDYAYDGRDPRYERDHRPRARKAPDSVYYEEEERRKQRMLSKQEKILAAFAGAALALGGKEVYDRHEAKEKDSADVERNYLQSAALGAAGAFAGYQGAELYNKHAGRDDKKTTHAPHRGRDGKIQEHYYSDDDEDMPAKKGHKKFLESVLGVTSMGAAMKALTGGDDSKSSRGRGRSRSSSRSSRSRGQSRSKLQKAAMASLIAGATEAFRVSKEPGGWKGEKAKRVVTAAMGAGALGTAHDEGHSKKDIFESVVGGLLGNRLMHGSKKNIEEDERDPGRSRSRSRARSEGGRGGGGGGLAALATAGLGALAAKKATDSGSRSRSRRRGSSVDSRSPSRRRQRSRSRSVVNKARKGLAKIGLGSGPESDHDDYEGSRYGSSRRRDRDRGYADDDYDDDDYRGSSRRGKSRDRESAAGYYDDYRVNRPSRRRGERLGNTPESDLGDSSDDERRAKKMRDRRH